ncbi:MAG: hypothetical protein NZ853_02105 [Leptospiraceae bacterium]|nr:hypothetical protein [Leptospiraceae bacterium]MDW7975981.1 hypothetical protein [Leptospiraceae bacterium]
MGRIILLLFGLTLLGYCTTTKVKTEFNFKFQWPDEFKRTGLITSSTYQVYFYVRGETYAQALAIAKREAVPLALGYILMEPFITIRITAQGKAKIRNIIQSKGRIVFFKKIPNNSDHYEVVFHVTDFDLFNKLKSIK